MTPQMITITLTSYNSLVRSETTLLALEEAGVDNWEGFEDAMKSMEDTK